PRESLLEPLHHNGRDRLAGDQAARLVDEHKGDARKQEADGDRRQAIGPRDVKEACGDHAGRRKANADQRSAMAYTPRAPELRHRSDLTPAEQFWIIKHGVKMTGMPAWGVTHDDELLWDVVAFVRKLPELTPEQYETMVKNAPKHEELMQDMEMSGDDKQNGKHEHE